MKKIIILIFTIISFQSFSQNVIADWAYLRQRLTLKDSIVTAITSGDTLATSEWVRTNAALLTGNNTEIFLNDNGSLGSSSNFTWNDTTLTVKDALDNVFIGEGSGSNITNGDTNTSLGAGSGTFLTEGTGNVFLGGVSGYGTTDGSSNVFIGSGAGYYNTTGTQNICIGDGAGQGLTTGQKNIFIGSTVALSETGSNKLYIDNSNTSSPLIKGDFATDELWLNTDTTHIVGHLEVDSNLYVYGRSILEKYEAAAYLDPDSTIVTNVNSTSWTFIGAGSNNKFTNIYSEGFALDGDTLYFVQNANDTRDSIEFNFTAHATTATGSVNRTIYYSIQIKSVGETTYSEERQITAKVRTQTANVYYSGATCTLMPVFLKDGDKIQLVQKCQTGTATVSMQDAKVYIKEQ